MQKLITTVAICFGNADQNLRPSGHVVTRDRRKIRAAEKRQLVGREKDVHRPPAASCGQLDKSHVNLIDVGPLFHVDLDIYEMLILQSSGSLVLERLMLHHMAP